MKYISTAEAAAKWNISQRRVVRLASEGRISGAIAFSKSWMIPEDAQKPLDGRTKQAKSANSVTEERNFRFPLYVDFPESSYDPPLSGEESLLRTAQLDFYQCRFEKAYQVFAVLAKQAESIYIKIAALFYMCLFPALYQQDDRWNDYCLQFNRCFENEFPHKKDMELFLPWLDMLLGQYFAASEKYQLDKEYSYDKSVRYLNACLSIAGMLNCDNTSPNLDSYEILCKNMEEDGYLYEALELHLSLFWTFMVIANEKSMLYHLNKAIKIAYDRRLIFPVANYAPYYSDIFDVALKEYPGDFGEKVRTFGDNIHNVDCKMKLQ